MKSKEIFSTVFAKAKDLASEIHLSYHWVACWIETMFTFEGTNIPEHLLLYIRSAFPNVEDVVNGDEEYVEWGETDLSKQIKAETTPAESLKLLRTTFGYTQQQLADKVGITKQQISAMERGREPIGRKMAHRLANALGTSYKNLFW